jgi:UDP-N-acetylmuramoyl-tripeptide--D-alanyl-D-alanine ligase
VITLILSEIVEAIGGQPAGELPTLSVRRVSTDSRSSAEGDLFFAIHGPRFDGHEFVVEALRGGAVAAVIAAERLAEVRQEVAGISERAVPPGAIIGVDDPVAALGRFASHHRRLMSANIIAVVGSNGKTTTKAMIHHILSERWKGQCSPKSFNNEIGVPLTLLSAEPADEYLVVEVGTNAPGEVAALAGMIHPDMAVLTCISEEHLERLGDLDGVAAEECSILHKLEPGGFAAVNIDAAVVQKHLPESGVSLATFGWNREADVRLTEARYEAPWLHLTINGRFKYRLPLAGLHNAVNAAGAITLARRLGLEHAAIAARLESFVLPPMRNEVLEFGGITLVNDAYNANPGSALAALDTLSSLPCRGRRIVVFGEMRELGEHAAELHRQMGEHLGGGRFDLVVLVGHAGELMPNLKEDGQLFGPRVMRCPDVNVCIEKLAPELRKGDIVLLKASRAVGLDRLVAPLRERLTTVPVA